MPGPERPPARVTHCRTGAGRELSEPGLHQHHPAQRVHPSGVLPGTGVHRVALTVASPVFVRSTGLGVGLGIPGSVIAVEAHDENVVPVVENLLCPVARMNVPVEDCDAVGQSGHAGVVCRDSDVVDETVTVGLRRLCVVTARPNERVRDGPGPGFDRPFGSLDRSASGVADRIPGRRRDAGRRFVPAAAGRGKGFDLFEVCRLVNAFECRKRCRIDVRPGCVLR